MDSISPALWLLLSRIFAVLTVLVVLGSFVTAGLLIQEARALDVHGAAAIALHVTTGLLALSLAGLAMRQRSHWWAPGLAFVLFAYSFLQAWLGKGMTIYLHIPGALLVSVAAVWLTAWVFTAKLADQNLS